MTQQYSDMTTYEQYVSNNSGQRLYPVTRITIHHMAGNLSVQQCANVLQNRGVSANYGVNGSEVGLYCAENIRTWASASPDNDNRAVTIEVANDEYGGEWHVSDESLETTIKLCADICKRQGISELYYDGTLGGSNLTRHDMFCSTTCPGPYLGSKFPYIVSEVNRTLNGGEPKPTPTPTGKYVQYQTRTAGWTWLPNVKNDEDYAGVFGNSVSGFKANLSEGHIKYTAHVVGKWWMPFVTDREDYAGSEYKGQNIDALAIKSDIPVKYRVHLLGGDWLPWVTGCDINDAENGYAGILGRVIDGVQITIA